MNRSAAQHDAPCPAVDPNPWIDGAARMRLAVMALLFVAFHLDILRRLAHFAWTEGDWSHAFLVPFFSLFFLHQRRTELRQAPVRPAWSGAIVMLAAMAGYVAGMLIGCDMLKGYAMIACLAGVVLLNAGWAVFKIALVPILYLAFAVKIDPSWWESIAWHLRLIAAEASVLVLKVIGIDAEVTRTTIHLWHGAESIGSLNVAQACSGMRMLMTFLALGAAVTYLWDRPRWTKIVMMAMTIPIAVAVNVGRVTVLGIIHLVDPKYATGDSHILVGMLMLAPALAVFMFVGWALGLFAGEADDPAPAPASKGAAS